MWIECYGIGYCSFFVFYGDFVIFEFFYGSYSGVSSWDYSFGYCGSFVEIYYGYCELFDVRC